MRAAYKVKLTFSEGNKGKMQKKCKMSLRKEEIEIIGSQNKCPFSVVEVY